MPVGIKIMVLVGLVAGLAVAFQLSYFPDRQIEELTRSLSNKAVSLSRLVAAQVESAIEFEDLDGIRDTFERFARDPEAVYAVVFSASGQQLAGLGLDKAGVAVSAPQGVRQPETRMRGGRLEAVVPITTPGGVEATLVTGFSIDTIVEGSDEIWGQAYRTGGIIILVGLFLGAILGYTFSRRLARIAREAEAVAEGDLSRPPLKDRSRDEIGRTGRAFTRMVSQQRELVGEIRDTTVQLSTTSDEFSNTARRQDEGATQQSTAVEQTRRTLEALLDSGREIARSATGVLKNAEEAQNNSNEMASRIAELSQQVGRITEILEVIKDIANKSELLALNAALEGTKAGEAGRGFSLVAQQMQRLAENVMGSVRTIRDLTTSIRDASQASVLATEQSTKLSEDTTRSARQITLIIQQQQSGTEQVAQAMNEVSHIATETAASSREILTSSEDVLGLCTRLQELLDRFRLDLAQNGGSPRVIESLLPAEADHS